MNAETRQRLAQVSTATLCTALFKRGLRNQFIQDVRPLNPGLPNMVGEAYTLRYIPAREDRNGIEVFQNREHPQRKAVEECPPGAVMVIDSRKDARAASAGGVLVARLMQRDVAGVVTDGGFRDSPDIAKYRMPAYHSRPCAPTNLTLHEAIDINGPIGCGDVPVFPGDVVVGDVEGVLVIPANLADEIAAEAAEHRVRGLRAGKGDGGPLGSGPLPAYRRSDARRVLGLAGGSRALSPSSARAALTRRRRIRRVRSAHTHDTPK